MTALARLITKCMNHHGWNDRDVARLSADAPFGPISHSTVVNYRTGNHPVARPNKKVLRVLSWVLDVPVGRMFDAAGVQEPLGEWVPPPEAHEMTREERAAITTLIRLLVAGHPQGGLSIVPREATEDVGVASATTDAAAAERAERARDGEHPEARWSVG